MTDFVLRRVEKYLVNLLGTTIITADLPKLVVGVMQFFEKFSQPPLSGDEKLDFTLEYVEKLCIKYGRGSPPGLLDQEKALIAGFITRICQASKGYLDINVGSATTTTAPTVATPVLQAPTPAVTPAKTPVTTPTPAAKPKRRGTLSKVSGWGRPSTCLDPIVEE